MPPADIVRFYRICRRSYLRRKARAEAAARNVAFMWLEKVQINKGANAPMLLANTKAANEAVDEELAFLSAGGGFTSGPLGGPAKRQRL